MRARRVRLSEADDAALREVEQGAGWHEKVRLRAKVVRLSHQGMSAREIAAYTGRHLSSVLRALAAGSSEGLRVWLTGRSRGGVVLSVKLRVRF